MTDLGNRREYLGASEIGAAMGYSPWETRHDLWEYKTGRRAAKKQTPQMARGHDLEPVIAKLYMRKTGRPVVATQVEFIHPDLPWLRYHADGTTIRELGSNVYEEGLLEFKAPGLKAIRDYLDAGLPTDYVFQLHAGMMLAKKPFISAAAYDYETHQVHHFDVDQDVKFQELILAGAEEFWWHVENDTPPPAQVSTIEIPVVNGELVVLQGKAYDELADLLVCSKSSRIMAEAEEERVIAEIKRVMIAQELGLVQLGRNVRISWKPGGVQIRTEGDKILSWAEEVVQHLCLGDLEQAVKMATGYSRKTFQKEIHVRSFRPTFYGEAKEEIDNAAQ